MLNARILRDYDKQLPKYLKLQSVLNTLMGEFLEDQRGSLNAISCRLKTRESLEGKINKKNYAALSDITDIVGVRVVSYFEDDIKALVAIIRDQFDIDEYSSSDKFDALGSSEFGYRSVHLVCSFDSRRFELLEYSSFKGIRFEIQLRTILQHAWAEIEHDIGYKSENAISDRIKRKFSRIASTLETVDEDFIAIKDDREKYLAEENERLSNLSAEDGTPITFSPFIALMKSIDLLDLAYEIISGRNAVVTEVDIIDHGYMDNLKGVGFVSIEGLRWYISSNKDKIIKFAKFVMITRICRESEGVASTRLFFYSTYSFMLVWRRVS